MAKFYIEDFDIINSFNNITSVSWEISLDKDFTQIVDSVYKSKEAIDGWYSSLPKIGEENDFYDEKTVLYIRCKVYSEVNSVIGYESNWYTRTINQTYNKKVKLRKDGKLIGEVSVNENDEVTQIW